MKSYFILTLLSVVSFAQTPPPPGGGPDDSDTGLPGNVPLDGFLFVLVAAAILLGVYYLNRRNRTILVK